MWVIERCLFRNGIVIIDTFSTSQLAQFLKRWVLARGDFGEWICGLRAQGMEPVLTD